MAIVSYSHIEVYKWFESSSISSWRQSRTSPTDLTISLLKSPFISMKSFRFLKSADNSLKRLLFSASMYVILRVNLSIHSSTEFYVFLISSTLTLILLTCLSSRLSSANLSLSVLYRASRLFIFVFSLLTMAKVSLLLVNALVTRSETTSLILYSISIPILNYSRGVPICENSSNSAIVR